MQHSSTTGSGGAEAGNGLMAGQSLAISESLIYVNVFSTTRQQHNYPPLVRIPPCIRVVDDVGVITLVTNGSILRTAAPGSIAHDGCHLL